MINQEDLMRPLHGASEFQILRAGVELGIFEALNKQGQLTLEEIAKETELMIEPVRVQMMGMKQTGLVEFNSEMYKNCEAITKYFEKGEYDLFKKMTLIQAHIMYLGQADYVESLRQNRNVGIERYSGIGNTIYEKLNHDPRLRKVFYDYMEAYSAYALPHLLKEIDMSGVRNVLDVGGGGGNNSIEIAKKYPNTNITLFDISTARDLAEENIRKNGLSERIIFSQGDMFKDEFTNNQDCVLFIHQLMIWSPEQNELLLQKAYDALNENGKVILFGSIGDHKNNSIMAALDSVYFRAVAAGQGMLYPSTDYKAQLKDVGFKKVEVIHCDTWTPHGIVIGYKSK
ncbi:methyltransferase [Bacteroidota bacterium]